MSDIAEVKRPEVVKAMQDFAQGQTAKHRQDQVRRRGLHKRRVKPTEIGPGMMLFGVDEANVARCNIPAEYAEPEIRSGPRTPGVKPYDPNEPIIEPQGKEVHK